MMTGIQGHFAASLAPVRECIHGPIDMSNSEPSMALAA